MASIDRVTNDSPGWDVEYDARSPVKRQKVAERAAKNGGKRIAILGAGGIGSVVGGLLAHAGHDVTLVDAWYEHINAVQKNGLLVQIAQREGPCKEVRTYPRAVHLKDLQAENGLFDYGFIAVNAYDTDWATALLDRYMKREGVLCCFQNGLNDERVAAVAGVDRTLGVVITISSAVYEPGVTIRTDLQDQSFKVGDIGGTDNARARELAGWLDAAIGRSTVTSDLVGQRWSKLMVNSMNNGLAGLTGWKTAFTRTHKDTRRIGIQIAAEAVRVARAHGHEPGSVMSLTPQAIVDAAEGCNVAAALAQLDACAGNAGELSRPSFGQDVLKGRRTEIDFINGLVMRKGREVGVPTPFCDRIVAIVDGLGVGFKPSPDHIAPLVGMLPR